MTKMNSKTGGYITRTDPRSGVEWRARVEGPDRATVLHPGHRGCGGADRHAARRHADLRRAGPEDRQIHRDQPLHQKLPARLQRRFRPRGKLRAGLFGETDRLNLPGRTPERPSPLTAERAPRGAFSFWMWESGGATESDTTRSAQRGGARPSPREGAFATFLSEPAYRAGQLGCPTVPFPSAHPGSGAAPLLYQTKKRAPKGAFRSPGIPTA